MWGSEMLRASVEGLRLWRGANGAWGACFQTAYVERGRQACRERDFERRVFDAIVSLEFDVRRSMSVYHTLDLQASRYAVRPLLFSFTPPRKSPNSFAPNSSFRPVGSGGRV